MAAWYERFFEGLYGRVLANQGKDDLAEARMVKRLLRARKGQQVLDVPCGLGRLTLPLARMGLEMTGVDLTARYIRKARQLARRRRLAVRFLRGDMRAIAFENEFDAAFNWFGSFGYFSDADNLDFCRRAFKALKPGGRFLVEGLNKPWLLSHFHREQEHHVGGVLVRQRSWLNRRKSHVLTTWTFKRGGATERHTIRMRLFDGAEIRKLLHAAGFREVKLFQKPLNRPFSRRSRRFIAVGRKPREMGRLRPNRATGAP